MFVLSLLLRYSDLDVNIVISITIAVHPLDPLSLKTDLLVGLATWRDLQNRRQWFGQSSLFSHLPVCLATSQVDPSAWTSKTRVTITCIECHISRWLSD